MKTLAQLEQDAQDLAAQIKLLKEKEEQAAAGPWEAAQEACNIMNRDKWIMPTM